MWGKLDKAEKLEWREKAALTSGTARVRDGGSGQYVRELVYTDQVDAEPSAGGSVNIVEVTPRKLSVRMAAKVGYGFLKTASEALASTGTGDLQSLKSCTRFLLTMATDADAVLRGKVRKCVPFRVLEKPQGRPGGSVAVTDAHIIEQLTYVSSESSTIHEKTKVPIRTLEKSKRRCAEMPALGLKKNQLAKRLRRCALGFADGKTQRGRCDLCWCWKQSGHKRVQHLLDDSMKVISLLCPGYFDEWNQTVECECLDEYELGKANNPNYISGLLEYVKDHEDNCADLRRLDEDKLLQLQTVEFMLREGLEGCMVEVENMAFHLSLKRTVDHLWDECWYRPKITTLYGLWDHMALLTLPRGPEETTNSWFANARSGVYVCSLIVWGAGLADPEAYVFAGRCKEKGALCSMSIFKHWLQHHARLEMVQDICWWSDGGKHFRSVVPISTMGVRGIEALCQHSSHDEALHTFDINFGVPQHFKNQCDGLQAHVKELVSEAAKKIVISDIETMVPACRFLHEDYSSKPKVKRMRTTWIDYFPEETRGDFAKWCVRFKASAFKEQISVCQAWSFRMNDKRRRANLMDSAGLKYSYIDFRAAMLRDGSRVPASRCALPEVAPLDDDGGEGEAEDENDRDGEVEDEFEEIFGAERSGNKNIGMLDRVYRGWQVSYRSAEPEKKDSKYWTKKLTKLRECYAASGCMLRPPRTKRPVEEQLVKQLEWKERKRVPKAKAAP